MNFFIVVLLSTVNTGSNHIYVVTDPTFETLDQCSEYGTANLGNVLEGMRRATGQAEWDKVACVDTQMLEYMLKNSLPEGIDA